MFTGIIESLGTLVDLTSNGTSLCLKIEAEPVFSEDPSGVTISQNGLKIGDSIAVNGVCLTITDVRPPYFEVTAVAETLGKTTFGSLIAGSGIGATSSADVRFNLERAATLETRLGGHLVLGHVDGVAELRSIRDRDGSWEYSFDLPSEGARYVVPKGSIALDGISLTVATIEVRTLTCAIIPHTYHHTTFQYLKIGDKVNVEFDTIAKMVERLVKPYAP